MLRCAAEGLSNRDIGLRLFISQNTVANHMRTILRKTGCANRTEATTYAHRTGTEHRVELGQKQLRPAGLTEPPATSNDQSSEATETGPPCGDGWSAPAWPWANDGDDTQALNAASCRLGDDEPLVLPSVGCNSSKPSKPS